jgi:superkiller protein 3
MFHKKFFLLNFVWILFLASCTSKQPTKSPQEVSDLYTDLGTSSLLRDDYPQAVEELRKAIALNPKNAVAHNHLGLAYYGLGKIDLAKQSIERAVLEDPNYSDAYINLGNFAFQEKNYVLAKHYFNKALSNLEYKYRHRAMTALAQVYIAENNLVEAKKQLIESLNYNPNFCLSHFLMGVVCDRENNQKCSADSFSKASSKSCAGNPEAHYQLGVAYLKLKDTKKAKNEFLFIVQNFPHSPQAQKAKEELNNSLFLETEKN